MVKATYLDGVGLKCRHAGKVSDEETQQNNTERLQEGPLRVEPRLVHDREILLQFRVRCHLTLYLLELVRNLRHKEAANERTPDPGAIVQSCLPALSMSSRVAKQGLPLNPRIVPC